ncbi:valine--pyruvate transaminase [Streptomyces sp. R08]|uniref:Valine--pyruvate transaminase n=1 Tax=Streptomyces sp. R08 TaxID=3238624 RepID=A0AB39MLM0_9ACTN
MPSPGPLAPQPPHSPSRGGGRKGCHPVQLSRSGSKMASLSGLRLIMDDIAATTGSATGKAWLNLGIGNPAAIPKVTDTWKQLTTEALAASFEDVSCRYGPSRGLPELVDAIAGYFNRRYGWSIGPRNIVVGPGSQMLCFIAAALFTGPGENRDTRLVLPMTPDYTGYQGLSLTPGGITGVEPVVRLEDDRSFRYLFDLPALEGLTDVGLMLLSSPSNPAGRCASPEEIQRLVAAARGHDVPLVVDNAYGPPFPAIGGEFSVPVWDDHVINVFSVSKTGLPGERLGFAVADERHIDPIVSFMSNSALHAPQLVQSTLAHALRSDVLDTLVATVIGPFYAERRKFVESLLTESLPQDIAWQLHAAEGGMFCWLWVDEEWFDDLRLYETLKRRGVFVVPGRHFFTDPEHSPRLGRHPQQCFRISITPDPDTIAAGVEIIAATLGDMRAGTV